MDISDQKTANTTTKTKWSLDPAHSEVSFKVKHMMITNVTGTLRDYVIEAYSDGIRLIMLKLRLLENWIPSPPGMSNETHTSDPADFLMLIITQM